MDQRHGETTKEEERVSITPAEMLQLRQLQMISSLQERLESWIKNRFRTALIAVSVSGFLGIQAIGYVLIDQVLGSKIDKANIQSAILENTAAALESETQSVKIRAKEALSTAEEHQKLVTKQLAELERQASAIDQKLQVALTKADAVSQMARFAVQDQIDSIVSAGLVPNHEQVKAEIERRRKLFSGNASYAINVHYLADREKDASAAIERMRGLGFEVRDTASSSLPDDSSKGRKSIGVLRDKYGINIVISPDKQKGQYVARTLANEFPDWEFTMTVKEHYGSSSTNIVFWGINMLFL